MLLNPPYHFGLVVEDLERARQELSRTLGLSWAATQRRTVRQESSGGPQTIDMCFVYSIQGPPYWELIEQRPDTAYANLGLHHVGMWTDNSSEESARLTAEGWARETAVLSPEGVPVAGFYHRLIDGLRVELVDAGRSGPRLVRYLTGGDYA